ncbi:CbtB domain-containing protein [Halovivax limisalsi]|uniref:CbtB domain-containing protein n=1 Tax=Halovivax limisalsi TaxID=1453760 RepID=UPI001FFD84E5|nr:CbtB domain-containing protein [Halovivax limisalsi]
MTATNEADTVRHRIELARETTTPAQLATLLALVSALTFALVVLQEPLVHDAVHDFRHAAGIVCH